MTNFEKIKSMSVEEFAEFHFWNCIHCCDCLAENDCGIRYNHRSESDAECYERIINWLNEEAGE